MKTSTLPREISTRILTHLGVDMSKIAVHQNSSIPSSQGQEFAVSRDSLYFAPGHYAPFTPQGRRVLAGAVSLFYMRLGDLEGESRSHRNFIVVENGERKPIRHFIVVENGQRRPVGTSPMSRKYDGLDGESVRRTISSSVTLRVGDIKGESSDRVGVHNGDSPIFIITDFLREDRDFSSRLEGVLSAIQSI